MDTAVKTRHIRTDSGVDSAESISTTLGHAQNLYTAVSSLASDNGFQALTRLIELLPKRDDELKKKDEKIQELNDKLSNEQKLHNDFTQRQLSSFEDRFATWTGEQSRLVHQVKELEALSEQRKENIATLRAELKNTLEKVTALEEGCAQTTKTLKEKEKILGNVEANLQSSRRHVEDFEAKQVRSGEEIAALKESNADQAKKIRAIEEKEAKARNRVMDFIKFSLEIKVLELPKIIVQTETLWKSATDLITTYFSRDFPSHVLQSDWAGLRENDIFNPRYYIPQSNSDVAKKMRVATILGIFTRLVDKFLFQPTFLLHEDSGLREYLCRLAGEDPAKERYTRGILLSLFPDEQKMNSDDVMDLVVDDLFKAVNVQFLLGAEMSADFKASLENLVAQFYELWKVVQQGKQKLEPSFVQFTSEKLPWHAFDLEITDVKQSKEAKASINTKKGGDGDIAIIPRLYLIGPEKEAPPITHGCVLQKAHIEAAEQEVRRALPSAPFVRATSNRHRNRSMRSGSLNGDATARAA